MIDSDEDEDDDDAGNNIREKKPSICRKLCSP